MMIARVQTILAWTMLTGSVVGLLLSLPPWRLIGHTEPLLVLCLSWIALMYAAVTALFAAQIRRHQEDGESA